MNKIFIILIVSAVWLNGCGHTPITVPPAVQSNMQQPQPMQVQKMSLTDKQMVKGKRLAKKVKKQLIVAQDEAVKAGGNVHVVCPATVPAAILSELEGIGVGYTVDYFSKTGYVIELSKDSDNITKSKGMTFSETQVGK